MQLPICLFFRFNHDQNWISGTYFFHVLYVVVCTKIQMPQMARCLVFHPNTKPAALEKHACLSTRSKHIQHKPWAVDQMSQKAFAESQKCCKAETFWRYTVSVSTERLQSRGVIGPPLTLNAMCIKFDTWTLKTCASYMWSDNVNFSWRKNKFAQWDTYKAQINLWAHFWGKKNNRHFKNVIFLTIIWWFRLCKVKEIIPN